MTKSDKQFVLNSLLLFFGAWFIDFLMRENGIISPFHWFYSRLQAVIVFIAYAIYYLGITALTLAAIAAVIWIGIRIHDAYLSIKKEFFPIENESEVPAEEESRPRVAPLDRKTEPPCAPSLPAPIAPVIEIKRSQPAQVVPAKRKLTEEEALEQVVKGLKERW